MANYDPKNPDFEEVPSIGPQSNSALRVDAPDSVAGMLRTKREETDRRIKGQIPWTTITPNDKAFGSAMLGAASGAALAGMPEAGAAFAAPVKAVGRGARSLADFIGGKLAGLTPEAVSAYKSAPRTVDALAAAPELRQSQFAENALDTASRRLGQRAGELKDELAQKLLGKVIPENDILAAQEFRPKGAANLATGDIPAADVYQSAKTAGNAAKFSPNPIDPLAEKARVESAGKEFGILRGAVSKAAPDAESTIKDLEAGIDAQQGLKGGRNKPISFFESGAPDTAANRQAADALNKSTRLERTADQLAAAKQIGAEPHGITAKFAKPVGKAILRTNAAASAPLETTTNKSANALLKLILGSESPRTISPKLNWSTANKDDFEDVQ